MTGQTDLDAFIDLALTIGEIAGGLPASIVHARSGGNLSRLAIAAIENGRQPSAAWTQAEDDYLRENLGFLPISQIAAALGRTAVAVNLRWKRDLRLPAPSKDPRYITARGAALILGIDEHKPVGWISAGLLPAEIIPSDALHSRNIRRIKKTIFYRWVTDTANWIWFDIDQVADPVLRNYLQRRRQRWGDEWWDTNQVAAYHGVEVSDIKRYIQSGRLRGVQARNYDGRARDASQVAWARWRILRSEATRPDLFFRKGRGMGHRKSRNASECAFILLARAIGHSTNHISTMTGLSSGSIALLIQRLISEGQVSSLCREFDLKIETRPPGLVFADWFLYRRRFPALARAMANFARYLQGEYDYRCHPHPDLRYVRGVLATWAARFAVTGSERDLAQKLIIAGNSSPFNLARAYRAIRSWGVDPLACVPENPPDFR